MCITVQTFLNKVALEQVSRRGESLSHQPPALIEAGDWVYRPGIQDLQCPLQVTTPQVGGSEVSRRRCLWLILFWWHIEGSQQSVTTTTLDKTPSSSRASSISTFFSVLFPMPSSGLGSWKLPSYLSDECIVATSLHDYHYSGRFWACKDTATRLDCSFQTGVGLIIPGEKILDFIWLLLFSFWLSSGFNTQGRFSASHTLKQVAHSGNFSALSADPWHPQTSCRPLAIPKPNF